MKKNALQDKQKRLERYVLFLYFIYVVFLTAIAQRQIWPAWLALIAGTSWLAAFSIHIRKAQHYQFRAFFTAGLIQINLVIWSICVESFSMIVPAISAMTVILGIYGIPNIIWQTSVTATFFNIYYLFRMFKANAFFGVAAIQTVLELISIYMVQYAMFLLLQKRLETAEQQKETAASLQAAEQDKNDFMSNLSHEIRTPIHTVCEMSEMILREDLTDQLRTDVRMIQAAGSRLLSIVSDVADFSQLQCGKMVLTQETYSISSIINDVIEMSMARNQERKLELIIDCSANIPCGMVGDEQKIKRAIMNIVDNALKFTTEGCVDIGLYTRDTSYGVNLIVRVKDTGIGMKAEHLEKMFGRFHQADTKCNRQEGGLGLGLAISQAIVEKMNGFLTVESEYGAGTAVQFTIPQKVTDRTPVAAIQNPQHIHALVYMNVEQFTHTKIRDFYCQAVRHMIEQLHLKCRICQNITQLKQKVERENFTHIFISLTDYEQDRDYFDDLAKSGKVIALLDRQDDQRIKNRDILRIYKPLFLLPVAMLLNQDQNLRQHEDMVNIEDSQMHYIDNLQNGNQCLLSEYLNESAGIKYCGGLQNYIEVLHMTSINGPAEKEKIQRCYDTKNWQKYIIYVHALKSSMINIGAEQLAHMAKELEHAGKQGDIAYIEQNHGALMQAYAQILTLLKEAPMPESFQDKRKGRPPTDAGMERQGDLQAGVLDQDTILDTRMLEQAAKAFETAAFTFDEDKMRTIAQQLAKCSYLGQRLEAYIEPIMRKIKMSDYLSAADAVAALKDIEQNTVARKDIEIKQLV